MGGWVAVSRCRVGCVHAAGTNVKRCGECRTAVSKAAIRKVRSGWWKDGGSVCVGASPVVPVERNKECKERKDGGRKGEVGLGSAEDSD